MNYVSVHDAESGCFLYEMMRQMDFPWHFRWVSQGPGTPQHDRVAAVPPGALTSRSDT